MLTAKADMRSKPEGLQKGADVYLEKPFNKEELLVRSGKLMEMRKKLQEYYLKKAGIITNGSRPVVPDMVSEKVREKPENTSS